MLPDYWLTRPGPAPDAATCRAFDALLDDALVRGPNALVNYTLAAPKWQFLCHVADHREVALHGSGQPAIALFEPRQSNDLMEFGNQKAVYAAADGLWAMYFAILDRDGFDLTLINACVRLTDRAGASHGPFYFFSITRSALAHRPFRAGTVYLLPRATFVNQPPLPFGDAQAYIPQLASLAPVVPLARLTVAPEDFPFLAQMRGHADERLAEYAAAMQTGAPLPGD
jgi:hypothetical protein